MSGVIFCRYAFSDLMKGFPISAGDLELYSQRGVILIECDDKSEVVIKQLSQTFENRRKTRSSSL